MKKLLYAALLVGATLQFTACENDDSTSKPKQRYDLTQGMVIANEGNYGKNNASISLYYATGDSLANDVYYKVNKEALGDVLQSIAEADTSAYLILNGSNKVVAVSKYSCKKYATISVANPRYMAVNGKTGYVTGWTNNEVAVVDLATNKVTGSIKVGAGPEGILINNGKLYVANSGGYDKNNTVSVIDIKTNTIEKTVTVADCPKKFVADKNGAVWVLCAGYTDYDKVNTNAMLCKITPSTYEVSTKIDLGSYHPEKLSINSAKDAIYYGGAYGDPSIYKLEITAKLAPTTPLIKADGIYGFALNPTSGEIMVMIADWTDANSNMVVRYNATGSKIKEYIVGVGPNSGYFLN
ncbi:DUF5074 domain-containing protein [uncultured Acetobacteroides sp.]|uniref:DUF5074 domain-containing protein n=1 Tax=uncultured Acetobacteroides sp. TaxID=1760811 RepID=UPI0029F56A28|nr:DUF5074 domain-containing protein [uncultured Acetobacteroides sp.]